MANNWLTIFQGLIYNSSDWSITNELATTVASIVTPRVSPFLYLQQPLHVTPAQELWHRHLAQGHTSA